MLNYVTFVGNRKSLPFVTPMIWSKPTNVADCYFCSIDLHGFNAKTALHLTYPQFSSAVRPTFFKTKLPDTIYHIQEEFDVLDVESSEHDDSSDEDFVINSTNPEQFTKQELNDLIRECGLCKEKSEVLASRLKEKNLLKVGTKVTFYRKREETFMPFFGCGT